MYHVISLLSGLLFGLGLIVSGMVDPANVLGFLDIFGDFNPSLAFVMGGAVVVGSIAFTYAKKMKSSFSKSHFRWPTSHTLDWRLIVGNIGFGIGWGVAGFCPGPAIVGVGLGLPKAILFVGTMLLGMFVFEVLNQKGTTRR